MYTFPVYEFRFCFKTRLWEGLCGCVSTTILIRVFFFFFLMSVSCNPGRPQTHYMVADNLLSLLLKCWDYRWVRWPVQHASSGNGLYKCFTSLACWLFIFRFFPLFVVCLISLAYWLFLLFLFLFVWSDFDLVFWDGVSLRSPGSLKLTIFLLCLASSRITGMNSHGHVKTLEFDLQWQYKGSLYNYTSAVYVHRLNTSMGMHSGGIQNHKRAPDLSLLLGLIPESMYFLGFMSIAWVECKGSE